MNKTEYLNALRERLVKYEAAFALCEEDLLRRYGAALDAGEELAVDSSADDFTYVYGVLHALRWVVGLAEKLED